MSEEAWFSRQAVPADAEAILFHTPLCGTCRIAERMLEVAEAAGIPTKLYKMNIAFAPRLRESWRIASVPCLVVLRDGHPVRFEYAMHSVVHLFEVLRSPS